MSSDGHRLRFVPSLAGPWRYERCERCGGFDSSIPTQCPGRLMTDVEKFAVGSGALDYVAGRWIDPVFDL